MESDTKLTAGSGSNQPILHLFFRLKNILEKVELLTPINSMMSYTKIFYNNNSNIKYIRYNLKSQVIPNIFFYKKHCGKYILKCYNVLKGVTKMEPINALYEAIGSRIQYIRKKKNITQEELAKKVDLARTSIVHIERGHQRLTIERLYKISNALDVSVHDILPAKEVLGSTNLKNEADVLKSLIDLGINKL